MLAPWTAEMFTQAVVMWADESTRKPWEQSAADSFEWQVMRDNAAELDHHNGN